jgi:release factor glutamine methyltransferase
LASQTAAVDDRLARVTARLAAAGCVAADEEAAELLAAAGAADDAVALERFVSRRERGEPLAWITGTVRFCDSDVRVAPGVYVPRAQSEELARRAAALLPRAGTAVDLCTGSGAIAAHLVRAVEDAMVVGVDVDADAARCAHANGMPVVMADLRALPLPAGIADIVTAVAPYVPTGGLRLLPSDVQRYEPRAALDGGADGLDLVRLVVLAAARLLRPGGWLLVEVGGEQDDGLAPNLDAHGFDSITTWRDEDGDHLRGLAAQRAH